MGLGLQCIGGVLRNCKGVAGPRAPRGISDSVYIFRCGNISTMFRERENKGTVLFNSLLSYRLTQDTDNSRASQD